MNDQQKQQVLEQVRGAKNVLVAVSSNPTVDELAASIGLTLALNKMDKHATTVFSGVVPSTIEFLQPEKTIETTTDSLRDFIIALDKSKADKLRYKVEDDVVRIFITPYRTSITEKDLEFSQGDFNVDVVIGLGVTKREDLDKAITNHGGILHDATVMSLTNRDVVSELGSVNWQDQQASSLCEMVAAVTNEIQADAIDGQMATALLTGIIAETDRFRNEKTSPQTLSISSQLMSAGANQQLIAEKLEEPDQAPEALHVSTSEVEAKQPGVNGELDIDHSEDVVQGIHIDEHGNLGEAEELSLNNEVEEVAEDENTENAQDENIENDTQEEKPLADDPVSIKQPKQSGGDVLFDELVDEDSDQNDGVDEPTLKQPDVDTPYLTHGMTIEPPVNENERPKSDKPFDLQEAMQETAVPSQIQPSAPNESPATSNTLPPPQQTDDDIPQPTQDQVSASPSPIPEEPNTPKLPPPPTQLTPPVTQQGSADDSAPNPIVAPIPDQKPNDTLAALEQSVGSSHASPPPMPPPQSPKTDNDDVSVDDKIKQAQEAVQDAAGAQPPQFPPPQQATGSQPVNLEPPKPLNSDSKDDNDNKQSDSSTPPPVPPPMTPQFFDSDGNNSNPFLNPNGK